MADFAWSPATISPAMRRLPGDLYCVRDAICTLMGWQPFSEEWCRFVEAPSAADVDRLIVHLGLDWCDPDREPEKFVQFLDHPGIAVYAFHRQRISHQMYQPHIRHLQPLPPRYFDADPDPELFRVIVDLRQLPGLCLKCMIGGQSLD